MRKFAFSFLFLAICCLLCGCGGGAPAAYYFNIVETAFTCTVGDAFNVFDEEIKTNLSTYEHMHIYSENSKVAKVLDDNTINILAEGETTIIVSGYVDNQPLSDTFTITANNSNVNPDGNGPSGDNEHGEASGEETEESGVAVFSATKILDTTSDERTVVYKIFKNDANFSNFTVETISNEDDVSISKVYNKIEVVFKDGDKFSLNILDKNFDVVLTLEFE